MRTQINLYMAVFVTAIISTGLTAQDSIEEITVTSSYVTHSDDEANDPIHILTEEELETNSTQSLGETIDSLLGVSSADYGAAVGQPIIRGMSGTRVKVLNNGLVVRDMSGIGIDHVNEVDLNAVKQIEVIRGPSSLMYSNGAIGGIVNVVDDTIAREDFADRDLRIGLEAQNANDGEIFELSYKENLGGLNLSYAFKDSSLENYDIPEGAVIHSEEHEEGHEEDHDEEHDEDHEEDMGFLENSDFESQSHRLGLSTTGDWGYFGASYLNTESVYGIPYHGEGHEGHGDEGHDDHDDDHDGEEDHDGDHDEHEGERIFSTTDSDVFNIEGSYVFDNDSLNSMRYYYRNSDYSLTEQHAEEEGHEGEEHDDDHDDDHDGHGHEEGPTVFSNESDEFGLILDFGDDSLSQKLVLQSMNEDVSIIGAEAFMNPVDSTEKMIGYYVGTSLMNLDLHLGIRHDRVNRKGTVAHHEEEEHHDDDDHDAEEDHDDEHHDEHEMESFDIDRNETSVALSIDREINENTLLTLGLASVKRAPSSVELFMNGAHLATGRFEVGDVTLESETSNNIDLTFDYENNGFFATATIFRNDVDDYIYLLDESEEEHEMHEEDDHDEDHDDHDEHDDHDGHDDHGGLILSNYMQKDAEFNGYEFELGRSVNVNGGSMSFSYGMDYVNAKFKDGGYVPRINPRRHIFSIDYAKEGTRASLTLRNVKSQNKLSLNETPTESYNMLDLKVSQSLPIFSGDGEMMVTLFAKNLLDEVARNHSSFVKDQVPLPGRNIGLRFNMKF